METLAAKTGNLGGWRRALAATGAGAFAVLAHAPYDFLFAGFLAFPVLVWLLQAPPGTGSGAPIGLRRALLTGWWFGLGYFVAGLWWIGNALLVEAESFAWALPIAVLALPAFLALFYGLACLPAGLYRGPLFGRITLLAAGFGVAEWLRGFLFTGFPWNAIGQAAMPVPLLMQPVAVIGIDSVNALAVFAFSAPALLAAPRRHLVAGLALSGGIFAAAAAYGHWRLSLPEQDARPMPVRIVQPAIDQAEKWDAGIRNRIFQRLLDLSAGQDTHPAEGPGKPGGFAEAGLIIWPETSVPFLFSDRPDALRAIGDMLGEGRVLLAGAVRDERDAQAPAGRRFFNSLLAIDGSGNIIGVADKVHLVPFGEYLPFAGVLERFGLRRLVSAPGVFSAAPERQHIRLGELLILPLICYEIIFASDVHDSRGGAGMIVNITNDAWYGDTPGPHQHLRQAQLRAVETGLPVLRAANNGISAAMDSRGRMLATLALNEAGSLDARIVPGNFPAPSFRKTSLAVVLLLFFAVAAMMHAAARLHPN